MPIGNVGGCEMDSDPFSTLLTFSIRFLLSFFIFFPGLYFISFFLPSLAIFFRLFLDKSQQKSQWEKRGSGKEIWLDLRVPDGQSDHDVVVVAATAAAD